MRVRLMREDIRACKRCPLYKTCRMPVPGEGDPTTGVVLLGRNPGWQEDRDNRPMVGAGGQALIEALEATGLERKHIYITNVVKCYTENDRPPRTEEMDACATWWTEEFKIIQPKLVLVFGSQAFSRVVGHERKVLQNRRAFYKHDMGFWYVGIVHPGARLRDPELGRILADDVMYAICEGYRRGTFACPARARIRPLPGSATDLLNL